MYTKTTTKDILERKEYEGKDQFEGVKLEEKYQRINFKTYEILDKFPSVDNLYISNIMRRTLSQILYTTIDEKSATIFKEKLLGKKIVAKVGSNQPANVSPPYGSRAKGVRLYIYNKTQGTVNISVDNKMYEFQVGSSRYLAASITDDSISYSFNLSVIEDNIPVGDVVIFPMYVPL